DGVDGQLGPGTSEADIANMEAGAIHPLTGPVFVKGARPGDVLEVEFVDIVPQPHAFTAIVPGLGFRRGVFATPSLGPSPIAGARQLTNDAKLLLPVAVEGPLFSTGDGHFAQGDGEVCVTAVEMGATAAVRFRVLKGTGAARALRGPRFSHAGYFAPPEWAAPRGFVAAMGMPIRDDGVNDGENLTLACRNALLNMIDLLQERGWSREQAYVLCSVAADLRISNVVDVPNYVVSALIQEGIFTS